MEADTCTPVRVTTAVCSTLLHLAFKGGAVTAPVELRDVTIGAWWPSIAREMWEGPKDGR